MKNILILLFIFCSTQLTLAQEPKDSGLFSPFGDNIPKGQGAKIAEDLLFEDQVKTPDELLSISENQWNGKLDFSELDPQQDPTYWNNEINLNNLDQVNKVDQQIRIKNYSQVQFLSFGYSIEGEARFQVATDNMGESEYLTLSLGPDSAQELMRKTLLRKIGYIIPSMRRVQNLKINFKSLEEKNQFLQKLEYQISKDSIERWITHNPKDENYLNIQDIYLSKIEDNDRKNLALGSFLYNDDVELRNRRIFNSLVVAYNILFFKNSVNMMKWTAGRVLSNNIVLEYPDFYQFQCSYEDGRWISRRINQLTRKDWEDVVASSELPGPIQALLIEKIISRRNSNSQLFDLNDKELEVNPERSSGQELVAGKLLKGKWSGYAIDYIYGDPESPLSGSEQNSLIYSYLIKLGLIGFQELGINSLKFLSSDNKSLQSKGIDEALAEKQAKAQALGEPQKLNLSSWGYGTYRANFVFGRELVAGQFQGIENTLSQVDTFGVILRGGYEMGAIGPDNDLINDKGGIKQGNQSIRTGVINASAEAGYSRLYAHVTPVISIKAANKKPFKNIIIPLAKSRIGKILGKDTKNIAEKVKEEISKLKEQFLIGESIIITDTIGGNANINGNVNYGLLSLNAGYSASGEIINRIHITRRSEHEFQIYKSFGTTITPLNLYAGLNFVLPIVRGSFQKTNGAVSTHFYSLEINEETEEDDQLIMKATALRSILINGSLEKLKRLQNPYKLSINFSEKFKSLGIFTLSFNKIKNATKIEVTGPNGEVKEFTRSYQSQTSGKNSYEYATDAISALTRRYLNINLNLSDYSLNPGFNITGNAFTKTATIEVEKQNGVITQKSAKISRIYNSFKADIKRVQKELAKLRKHYRYQFHNMNILSNTNEIFLYRLGVNLYIHPEGIDHILGLAESKIHSIFNSANNSKDLTQVSLKEMQEDISKDNQSNQSGDSKKIIKKISEYKKLQKTNEIEKSINVLNEIIQVAEENLSLMGLVELAGGEKNMYAFSTIDGFREGEEYNVDNSDESSLISNSVGIFGQHDIAGPLSLISRPKGRGGIGISEGELFISWILKRAI